MHLQGLTSRWEQLLGIPTREGIRVICVGIRKTTVQGARMAAGLLVIPDQWVFA